MTKKELLNLYFEYGDKPFGNDLYEVEQKVCSLKDIQVIKRIDGKYTNLELMNNRRWKFPLILCFVSTELGNELFRIVGY